MRPPHKTCLVTGTFVKHSHFVRQDQNFLTMQLDVKYVKVNIFHLIHIIYFCFIILLLTKEMKFNKILWDCRRRKNGSLIHFKEKWCDLSKVIQFNLNYVQIHMRLKSQSLKITYIQNFS